MIQTKIICTIGPMTESYEILEKMVHAGMNVARLNFSHGDHAFHQRIIKNIKKLNRTLPFPVGILLDTKGPEIRTGDLDHVLEKGQLIEVTVDPQFRHLPEVLYIDYPDLIDTVPVGKSITIDNGLINLKVLARSARGFQCQVEDGGPIKGRRHVNLPGTSVNLPNLTEKDKLDIRFGIENNIDFIALSFVRNANTLRELNTFLGEKHRRSVRVIAKIESQDGVTNLEEILEQSDGIMVARGDLGVEINIEDLPHVQRQIAALCGQKGKRLIVATHLLESMIEHPFPTRAEVTDVTNAIYEEADALMLSGETTVGKYPLKCIELLGRMARKTESFSGVGFAKRKLEALDTRQHLMISAVKLSMDSGIRRMVVLTKTGRAANYVSNCRPHGLEIFAMTDDPKTCQTLSLSRGVFPFLIKFYQDPERTVSAALDLLKERGIVQIGDELVVASDIQVPHRRAQAIQIRRVD